jgi:hypothetical protein
MIGLLVEIHKESRPPYSPICFWNECYTFFNRRNFPGHQLGPKTKTFHFPGEQRDSQITQVDDSS